MSRLDLEWICRLRRGLQDRQRVARGRPARHVAVGGQHRAQQAARALRRPAVRAHRAGHAAHAPRAGASTRTLREVLAQLEQARGSGASFDPGQRDAQLPHLHDRHQRGGAAARPARPPAARRRPACASRPRSSPPPARAGWRMARSTWRWASCRSWTRASTSRRCSSRTSSAWWRQDHPRIGAAG